MHEVFEQAFQLATKNQSFVLATVIRTSGSSPQKAGAKMLIRPDGENVGTLGGGCVEGDIWYIAREMLRKEEGAQFRKYQLNEELAARDGLVCGGTMYFFIEPFPQPAKQAGLFEKISRASREGPSLALTTVVQSPEGQPPLASRMLVYEDGTVEGGLGKTALDQEIRKVSRRLAAFGDCQVLCSEDGVEVFIEGITTPPTLIILGGGHVGKAVSDLAGRLGYRIFVIDDREEFADPARFPEAEKTIMADFENALAQLPVSSNSFILIATRGHRFDDVALESAVETSARYIGLLGSKRKTALIYRRLIEKGVATERIRQIHAPVGLDIGALTPDELAVSILAEIIAIRRSGKGGFMKMDAEAINRLLQKSRNE